MDAQTPPPPPPQPAPAPQPYQPLPPPRSGMGCFGKGCLILFVFLCLLAIACITGGYYVFHRAVHVFTSTQAEQIQIPPTSPTDAQNAEVKANTLREAIRNNQETTVEFTANDLNALIANDPDFRGARGHVRVAIADSLLSMDVSAPLETTGWKMLRGRWFNGHVQLGFSYVDEKFSIDLKSAEANGHSVPSAAFTSQFSDSFNQSLNDSFRRSAERHHNDFWRRIKMISVQGDKLIVTTRVM